MKSLGLMPKKNVFKASKTDSFLNPQADIESIRDSFERPKTMFFIDPLPSVDMRPTEINIVKNRYPEFERKRSAFGCSLSEASLIGKKKEEKKEDKTFMVEFFTEVNLIQSEFENVHEQIELMEKLRVRVNLETSHDSEKTCVRELEDSLHCSNKYMQVIKARVERIQKKTEIAERAHPPKMDESEIKIRKNMVGALMRKFSEHIRRINDEESAFRHEIKQRAFRQLQIACPQASTAEIESMIDNGETAEQIMRQKMIGVHASVADAINRVQEKHRDVQRLERSMADLHKMMTDMARLVDHQGEIIDSIYSNVQKTNYTVKKGEQQLIETEKIKKNTRKYKCCGTLIVTIILFVLVMLIAT